jgi:hypothetical protein
VAVRFGFLVVFAVTRLGPQTRFLLTVRQYKTEVLGRGLAELETVTVGTIAGAVPAGFVVDVVDAVVPDPDNGTVVLETGTGAMTGGAGKLAGQRRACDSGFIVSSGGQPTPIPGEIHW